MTTIKSRLSVTGIDDGDMAQISFAHPGRAVRYIKDHKKDLFWLWIAYQTIKGITTTSLIWVPLFLAWKGMA